MVSADRSSKIPIRSPEEAWEIFDYNPRNGEMYWKKLIGGRKPGPVGQMQKDWSNRYLRVNVRGIYYRVHRIVWFMHKGSWPKNQIDHINGNGLDNRIENLRDVTPQENLRNCRLRKNNTSGFNGIHWQESRGRWQAALRVNGKSKFLGRFKDFEDAKAVLLKAREEAGYHELHGTPKP